MALSKIDADGVSGLQATLTAATTVPSEGGAATTNLVQGLAKAWLHINTDTIEDSFNIASVADNGTGDHSPSLTNAMSNANYTVPSNVQLTFLGVAMNNHVSSSSYRTYSFYVNHGGGNNPAIDTQNDSAIHGDLA
jgi:hypothetical protein